jgi:hypothetical protein
MMERRELILELCRQAGDTGPEDEIIEDWEATVFLYAWAISSFKA